MPAPMAWHRASQSLQPLTRPDRGMSLRCFPWYWKNWSWSSHWLWTSVYFSFSSSFLPLPLPSIPFSSAYLSSLGSWEYGGVALPEGSSHAWKVKQGLFGIFFPNCHFLRNCELCWGKKGNKKRQPHQKEGDLWDWCLQRLSSSFAGTISIPQAVPWNSPSWTLLSRGGALVPILAFPRLPPILSLPAGSSQTPFLLVLFTRRHPSL